MNIGFLGPAVATVLTVYGIETAPIDKMKSKLSKVATVLTVYGIETHARCLPLIKLTAYGGCNSTYRLRY